MKVENDGLRFEADTIRATAIREEAPYGGVRITLLATLQTARIPIQVDIGTGDAVTPEPVEIEYPTILDLPAPTVRAYPLVTVVAEKYEALTTLGMANSRRAAG